MIQRILFLGDSIGAAPGRNFVVRTVDFLQSDGYPALEYVNSSVDSSNVLDLLDRTQELLPQQQFDVALVFVGVNDSKILVHLDKPLVPLELFQERLDDLATRLEMTGARVVLCGLPRLRFDHIRETHILDAYWYWTPVAYEKYDVAIASVAKTHFESRRYVNLHVAFSGQNSASLFQADGVHPNGRGHEVIAAAIIPELRAIL